MKKIEFSPPRKYESPLIIKPNSKQLELETIYSYKDLNKVRTESLPNSGPREKNRQSSENKPISQQPSPKIASKKDGPFILKPQIIPQKSKPLPKITLREAIRIPE